jgi:hypothetical protein
VGPGPRVRDWAVGFGGGEEAHYRMRWRTPHAADWSAAFGGGEEMHHCRRWRTPHAAVRFLHTWSPTPKEHDSWARAPVPETGSPWRVSGEVFCGASGRQWGNPSLKRDSPSVVAILISALSPSSSPRSYAVVATMALLGPPERLQPEVALNLVRNLLGWGVLAFAGRIRVGVSPHGDLATGEFVFFISKLPSGLALPILSFFVLLLEGLGLQPLHVTPFFILQAAIIAYIRGMSVEATLLPASSSSIWGEDDHQPREGGQRAQPRVHPSRPQLFGVGSESCYGSISLALMASVSPPTPPPTAKRGMAARQPHGRRSRRAQVRRTRNAPLRRRPPQATLLRRRPGGRMRRRTSLGWRSRAWMVLSSPP